MIFAPFGFKQQQISVAPTPAPTPVIITSGLTIYVNSFDTASYPGTGSTWTSVATGTTFNGSLFNSPTFDSNEPENFAFNGTNQYVDFGDASSGSTTSSYTWGGWVKLTTLADGDVIFGRALDDPDGNNGWSLFINISANKVAASVVSREGTNNFAQSNVIGTTTLSTDVWYYIVAVWRPSNYIRIFLNGVQEGSTSVDGDNIRNTAGTGFKGWFINRGANKNNYSPQTISLFHRYNRELIGTEILSNFDNSKQYYGY
jgi:hypothetical protein